MRDQALRLLVELPRQRKWGNSEKYTLQLGVMQPFSLLLTSLHSPSLTPPVPHSQEDLEPTPQLSYFQLLQLPLLGYPQIKTIDGEVQGSPPSE